MSTTSDRTTAVPDLDAVLRWLERVGAAPSGPLTARPVGGGRSNPTFEVADGTRSWVLRRPPTGHVLPTAHDMSREYRVMQALRDTAVPVPAVVGLCQDEDVIGAPFYVMEKVEGRTLRTQEDTRGLHLEQRRSLSESFVRTVVALHEIEPADVGLDRWGRVDGYLERQLRRWRSQWEASVTHERRAVTVLLDRLAAAVPPTHAGGIVHGDLKIDNVMVDFDAPGTVVALLDWEMSTLGDTLADVGVLLSFWDQPGEPVNPITAGATALPGFWSRDEVLEAYLDARGGDATFLPWYVVLADLKVAIILEGIHARHLQGHTVGSEFEDLDVVVDQLVERGLRLADQSGI